MMTEQMEGQLSFYDLDIWSGKTSPEPSAATKAKTSALSSKKRQRSQKKTPLFLNLIGGGWTGAGCVLGNGWSIAWRLHDAQFWGVPQRRKRIALVADFGGQTAPEILFERKGLSGDLEPSGAEREEVAGSVEGGAGSTGVYCLQGNGIDRADTAGCNGKGWRENQSYTLNTIDRPGVYDARGNGEGNISPTITGDHENRITDYTAVCIGNGQVDQLKMSKKVGALNCMHDQMAIMNHNYIRRLTPLECERLQGYPDGWTDIGEWTDSKGKKHKDADTPRYKAIGNSIALPFWQWLARRICAQYIKPVHMGSLFDGIGGFPLVFERAGGVPVWASEIEEFAIAVTKKHFKEV